MCMCCSHLKAALLPRQSIYCFASLVALAFLVVLAFVAPCFVVFFEFFLLVALGLALPRQVLHLERTRLCLHMLEPPHSLHWERCQLCLHTLALAL